MGHAPSQGLGSLGYEQAWQTGGKQRFSTESPLCARESALHLLASGEKMESQRGEAASPRSQLGSGRAAVPTLGCLLPEPLLFQSLTQTAHHGSL